MEKSSRLIPLIYGYAVCLTAIIVTLISVSMIIGAIFDLQDPLRSTSGRFFGPTANISSFEAYKIDILTGRTPYGTTPSEDKDSGDKYTPSDEELRAAFEANQEDHIAAVKLSANRDITNGVILLLIAAGLFFSHWSWLKRLNAS